jgi:putative hydrolase of the HAD superfamily
MLPKAILLDLDDTIIAFDHGVDLNVCWKNACSRHLPQLSGYEIEELINVIKKKAKWFWSDSDRHRKGRLNLEKARLEIVAAALHDYKLEGASLHEDIAISYGLERDKVIKVYPGAIETLTYMRSLDIKLALITNGGSQPQRKKIERFELANYFDCIIIEEEFGAGKPDQSVYLYALEQLGVQPDEAWMIGDNFEWEVIAPQRLGIKGIWINHKGADPALYSTTQPFITITTLRDILRYLPRLHS